jgi:aspartoacylase
MADDGPGRGKVLVVGGTHGNEVNAPWLLETGLREASGGLELALVIGNPEARAAGRRYLDRDLNRCFDPERLADPGAREWEVLRARQLLELHGPEARDPALVVLDLHSTTAAMGNSLVVYGRRPADLALAAALQQRLGLPIYLHEGDPRQSGYLVERWPCGLVIEVGPVPQGVLNATIVNQTRLVLEVALEVLATARQVDPSLPRTLVVHRHLGSLDLPRQADGAAAAMLHPRRLGRDWQPMQPGDPLFLAPDGETIGYAPPSALAQQTVWPVFINEAAYGEKGIALSLTRREEWRLDPAWGAALQAQARQLRLVSG